MTSSDKNFITVGKIGATYGIHGWLKIRTYTEYGDNILDYSPWYLLSDNTDPMAIEIEDSDQHGDGIIIKLKGIETPEAARAYTGKVIAITRDQLPTLTENEFYWSDLQGMTVIKQDGTVLGPVVYLIETGSNDALVIKHDGKEHAIPYLPGKVILNVDLVKREITVDWELF